ncbi:hypothetical protein C8F04DRAFT_1184844 [Mycena alexandri]|uniref:Uncharacterized protein n=1 Tax=Mycena alexandri TaxID=1745969 RepID=A0AAD6ST79_9AGAR|nr:hypothetical protein C8F04DRAFT_1184844 [Mycena alexandri]
MDLLGPTPGYADCISEEQPMGRKYNRDVDKVFRSEEINYLGPSAGNWFDHSYSGKRAILPLFTRSSAPNIVAKAGIPLQKTLERLSSNKIGLVRIVVVERKSKDGAGAESAVQQNDSEVSAYHSPDCGVRAATEPVETELKAHSPL